MALDAADLVVLYSRLETRVIRRKLRALQFVSRDYEAELQNAKSIQVPTRNNTVTATSFSRGGAWKTAQEADVTLQKMTMRGNAAGSEGVGDAFEVGNKLGEEDYREGPLDQIRTLADDQGNAMGKAMNTNIYKGMMHADHGANGSVTGALLGTKGATNAAWVDDMGEIQTAGSGALDADFMLKNLRIFRSFFVNADLMFVGEIDYETSVIMSPPLWYNMVDRFLDQKYTTPGLNFEVISRGTLNADANGRVGFILGMSLYIDPEIKALDSNSADNSANEHSMLALARGTDWCEFATRPPTVQYLTPQTNQTSPDYVMRSIRPQVTKVTQRGLAAKMQIRRTQNG